MTQAREADLTREWVNRRPSGPTEPDEQAVLDAVFGAQDADGFYRGEPQ